MRLLIFAFYLFGISLAIGAEDARTPFYSAPTNVNLGGRPVVADIDLYANEETMTTGAIIVELVTDVTDFIEDTEADLERWVEARTKDCGERWATGDPLIAFPDKAIRFSLALEYEYWQCGWNGKGQPRRIMRETGSIDVTLTPKIVDGRLQADLTDFALPNRTGVNQYLPLEIIARRIVEGEIRDLNKNPRFYRAPQPLAAEGFEYLGIKADLENDRVIIKARYRADGDAQTLARISTALREGGIYSER